MLLTDSGVLSIDDLTPYESEILTICTANDIAPAPKLTRTLTEVAAQLQSHLQAAANVRWFPNTLQSLLYNDRVVPRIRNEQIVVTEPLKLWLIYRALELIFRDAWSRKQNDKYESKYTDYEGWANRSRDWFFDSGIGVVWRPLPKPGTPALSTSTAGALAARSYSVQITWQDSAGNESAPSDIAATAIAINKVVVADISALTPPAGETLTAGSLPITLGEAVGWNVYAASQPDAIPTRQNAAVIPIATKTWTEPVTGLAAGTAAGSGQPPDSYRGVQNAIMRG